MPTQEEVFADIIKAVEAGAKSVGRELEPDVEAAIRARYFDWILVKGQNEKLEPVEPTPQDVWDKPDGELLRKKFEEIGRRAAQQTGEGAEVAAAQTDRAADGVEAASDCPWCRTA